MNTYDILYWLVTIIGIIAAGAMVYLVHLLVTVHLSAGAVHAWLDTASDEYADYMEDEQERRTALYHGDPDASSLRRWYGLSYLVERRLFVWQYNAAAALNKRQLGMREDAGEAGAFWLLVIAVGIAGGVYGCTVDATDVERETTCIENSEYINDLGGNANLSDC